MTQGNHDITSLGTEEFKLGEKIDAVLKHTTNNGVNWEDYPSMIEICGDYDTLFGIHLAKFYTEGSTSGDCLTFDFYVTISSVLTHR